VASFTQAADLASMSTRVRRLALMYDGFLLQTAATLLTASTSRHVFHRRSAAFFLASLRFSTAVLLTLCFVLLPLRAVAASCCVQSSSSRLLLPAQNLSFLPLAAMVPFSFPAPSAYTPQMKLGFVVAAGPVRTRQSAV
jgi:hypothetical protein